ncbi:MAG: hypothetical protein M1822_006401 [Bathelium mastoideum]|nr:MAG: hypothetical protein M1822_006401 [Bathelium mastoideum]
MPQRVQDGYESNRIDDMQAVFLVEVYTQYMNRRTPPSLSNRFKILYHTLSCDASIGSAIPLEGILGLHPQTEELSLPPEWMPLSELLKFLQKRRLRAVCYVFESQKRNLFPPSRDYDCLSGLDLPFVCSTDVWDSATPAEMLQWRDTADFAYVSEVLNGTSPMSSPTSEPFDTFRSALLVAAAKETEPSLLDSARLEQTSSTQLLYLANLLSHYTPLRPLLAVAGETWVMGEKLATNDEYQSLRAQLRAWTTEQGHTDSAAINTALRILRLELNRPPAEAQTFTLIEQWAIYLAALVLWATGYTIQHPKRDPGILPSHKEPTLGEVRIPVHSTLNAIEQGKWKEVVKGNGVMEALKDVRIKINGSSNGLLVEAVLVLGKLVDRGAEEGWF